MEHIVKMTIYLRNMTDYQAMRDAEFQYYHNHVSLPVQRIPLPAPLFKSFLSQNQVCSWSSTPSPSYPTLN